MLTAAQNMYTFGGMLKALNVDTVQLDHLVLDGNRSARIGSAAYQMCKSGGNTGNRYGYNAQFLGCANCSLSN